MADDRNFCYKCGMNLPEGADYCPECGTPVHGDGGPRAEYTARPEARRSSDMGALPILMTIYGVIAIVMFFVLLLTGLSLNSILQILEEMAESDPSMADYIKTLTEMMISYNFTFAAVIILISGIFALISASDVSKQQHFQRAMICCGIATVVPLFTLDILLTIIGIIVMVVMYSKRDYFIS